MSQEIINGKELHINCNDTERCVEFKKSFIEIINSSDGLIEKSYRMILKKGGIKKPTYFESKQKIIISFTFKPIIRDITVEVRKLNIDPIKNSLSLYEGVVFEDSIDLKIKDLIKKQMKDMGYYHSSLVLNKSIHKDIVDYKIKIIKNKPVKFKKINIKTKYKWIKNYFYEKLKPFLNEPFQEYEVKRKLEEIKLKLISFGYYLLNFEYKVKVSNHKSELDLNINSDKLYIVDIVSGRMKNNETKEIVKSVFYKYKVSTTNTHIQEKLKSFLETKAYYNPKIVIRDLKYKNDLNVDVSLKRIKISEKKRTNIRGLFFKGNFFFSDLILKKKYNDYSFDLAKSKYIDTDYYTYYKNYLTQFYIKNGFVQVHIDEPTLFFSKDKEEVDVVFTVKEGVRTFIDTIKLTGVPLSLQEKMYEKIHNKQEFTFDPIKFDEDINIIFTELKNNGYLNARLLNDKSDIVQYSNDFSSVLINIKVSTGKKFYLNNKYFFGIEKTRSRILEREVNFKKGDLLTLSKLNEIKKRISRLGLFSTVTVKPMIDESITNKVDLVITVKEKKYTFYELAPGYRTDLGVKASLSAVWSNYKGKNQNLSFGFSVNKRINGTGLDSTRKSQNKDVFEGGFKFGYNANYIFSTELNNSSSVSYFRKRYYSFDAIIGRGSTTFSYPLSKKFTSSLNYRLENIKQFDATDSDDDGRFKVGSVTPSLTYDGRNRTSNPTKGVYSSLSYEHSAPGLGSDDEIEYYKFISRNYFYIPFNKGAVAFYYSLGVQKNNSNTNSIPDIKVFRLSGNDVVRGFDFDEMNTLKNGKSMADVTVEDTAYLSNFKIEPRFFINDTMALGIFYDAGRIFVNDFKPLDLRSSVGISFKYLTPVGSLDFDYGFKVLRKRKSNGILESPGRLHISIGFF
jgi:outer membrane protein insertion porin family